MSDELGEAADAAIEHAGADAAAGLAGKGAPAGERGHCLNCGAALTGDFCQSCGQSARSLRRPFWALIGESLETLFALDGRVARTVPALMLRPGRVSRDYLDGRRARFIPPFRLYVLASLVFFVLLPLAMGQGVGFRVSGAPNTDSARAQVERAYEAGSMSEQDYREAMEGLDLADQSFREAFGGAREEGRAETGSEAEDDTLERVLPPQAMEAIREGQARGDEGADRLARVVDNRDRLAAETRRWIPRLMFVMLPIYALLLAMTYLWRRRFFFFDHLIVSLHFHAALFFAMSLGVLAAMVVGWWWVSVGLLIYSNAYLYRIHRVTYGRGRFSSVVRTLTLDFLYFIMLSIGLGIAFALGAMSI
ncbi:DUF3667 domain-containing protein [Glycocaulis profundi]|nr:DUF3667 domain-containing protein [Glycocaulis profundi]